MDRTQIDGIDELVSVDMDTIISNENGFSDIVINRLANIHRQQEQQVNATPLPLTEQNYLDLANTTKDIIAEKSEKLTETENKLTQCKRMLYKVYGLTAFVSEIMNGYDSFVGHLGGGVDDTMQHNLEYINSELENLFKNL